MIREGVGAGDGPGIGLVPVSAHLPVHRHSSNILQYMFIIITFKYDTSVLEYLPAHIPPLFCV